MNDTTTIKIAGADVETLQKLYIFKEPAEIIEFLEKNPFLIPLILEAHPHIRKHFPESRLYLNIVLDPEINNDQLAILISRPDNLNAEERIDTLERIDDDWWLDAEKLAQEKMFIGYE